MTLMPRRPRLFWIGLLFYFVSFFLVAAAGTSDMGQVPGFIYAFYALISPMVPGIGAFVDSSSSLPFAHIIWFSVLVSGWINPVFFSAAVLMMDGNRPRLVALLRVGVILMIPFTWLFFATNGLLHPREGYFLWVTGIVMVVVSDWIAGDE
jgi:hypothetical protein